MALKPVKYIHIDDQKGALYSAGKQSLLVPVTFIKVLSSVFVRLIGRKGGDILIYKIGEALGRGYSQSLEAILKKEKTKVNKETKIKLSCNAIFMEAGWGRIKIRKVNLSERLLEVEIAYSPSREFLEKSSYGLEKGVLTGIYQEITKQKVFCKLVKEDRKKHTVILRTLKETPKEIREKEKIVLLTRRKLEQMMDDKTKELQERIDELNLFHKLTVGRELKMIELKEKAQELKKQLGEVDKLEEISKKDFSKAPQNCWEFWKCEEKVKKDCPAYKTNSGRECWLVTSECHPRLERGFKNCSECTWFKKLNKSPTNKI